MQNYQAYKELDPVFVWIIIYFRNQTLSREYCGKTVLMYKLTLALTKLPLQ